VTGFHTTLNNNGLLYAEIKDQMKLLNIIHSGLMTFRIKINFKSV